MFFCCPTTLDQFRQLAVQPTHLRLEDAELLRSILDCPEAERIGLLEWKGRCSEDLLALVDLLPPGLSELRGRTPFPLDVWTRVLGRCRLRKLDVDPDVGGDHVSFFRALEQSSVVDLAVGMFRDPETMQELWRFLGLDRLESLYLYDSGASMLGPLVDCGRLVELWLVYCEFDQTLVVPSSVRRLRIENCKFGPDETFVGLDKVRDLRLSGSCPRIVPALTALLRTKGLDRLCLENNGSLMAKLGASMGRVGVLELWWVEGRKNWAALRNSTTQLTDLSLWGMNASGLDRLVSILRSPNCGLLRLSVEPSRDRDRIRCEWVVVWFGNLTGLLAVVWLFPSEMLRETIVVLVGCS